MPGYVLRTPYSVHSRYCIFAVSTDRSLRLQRKSRRVLAGDVEFVRRTGALAGQYPLRLLSGPNHIPAVRNPSPFPPLQLSIVRLDSTLIREEVPASCRPCSGRDPAVPPSTLGKSPSLVPGLRLPTPRNWASSPAGIASYGRADSRQAHGSGTGRVGSSPTPALDSDFPPFPTPGSSMPVSGCGSRLVRLQLR